MNPGTAFTFRRAVHFLLIFAMAAMTTVVSAAEVAARASLSRGSSVIGESIQFQIKVTGAKHLAEPPEIKVDGLDIRYAGPSEQSVIRFQNGVYSSERTVTLVYQVVPQKNGNFTIPATVIEADGATYRTEPVGLTVQPNAANAKGSEPQATGFAEFVVPKKTAYIGETIPVELRLYVDARVRWQPVAMPEISGEGFTKQKLPEPTHEREDRNGREYDVLIFKTAITPSRAGKITLGPSEISYLARVPRARRNGPRSLFDMFDDDVFGDPFFSSNQQLKATAGVVEIAVKPLPAAGKPSEFSGAVGHFQLVAEGNPKQVKIGDPVTMTLRVSGKGNFDRMNAPALKDSAGWRTYPPSSSFKADDMINYTGTKTFEFAVVPEKKQAAMPVFAFSYFDPLAEKYVTLNSETSPLVVEGNASPLPPARVAADSSGSPATPTPAAAVDDILGLRYDRDAPESFAPVYLRREFWVVQGALGFGFLAFLGLRLRRVPDAAVKMTAELRREKAAAWVSLRGAELPRVEFLETAARLAQIETALATGRSSASVDGPDVHASAKLSDSATEAIDEIFATRAELLYAGSGPADDKVSETERERILGALHELEKSHARS